MDEKELDKRAQYVECDEEQNERIGDIRKLFSEIYQFVDGLCKPGRETSLVYTKLEEAQFWAIKGISREKERI